MHYSGIKSIEELVKRSVETFQGSDGYSPQGIHQRPDISKPAEGVNTPMQVQQEQGNPFSTSIKDKDKGYEIQQLSQPEKAKKSSQQILLRIVHVDAKKGASVIPSNCPAKGRVNDYGKTDKGGPACSFKGDSCPYFVNATFKLDDYFKEVTCNVDEKFKEI